jgi:hypothetical protein
VYAGAVVAFAYYFSARHLLTPQWPPADFRQLVAGTGVTPMQYRALIPWIVRGLRATNLPGLRGLSLDGWRLGIDVTSVVAALYSARWLLRRVGFGRVHALLGSALVALILPFHYLLPPVTRYYPYDLASIAFFSAGVVLLIDERWRVYYPLFLVATLNRETTCFLTLAYVFAASGRERPRTIVAHAGAQALIWTAIKVALIAAYGANNQAGYVLHLDLFRNRIADNLLAFRQPGAVPIFAVASAFAFLWIPVFTWHRRIRHPFIRRAIWIVPVYFVAMFYVGEMPELRVYGEFIPLVAAAALLIAADAAAPAPASAAAR